jgi:hypothetical protein
MRVVIPLVSAAAVVAALALPSLAAASKPSGPVVADGTVTSHGQAVPGAVVNLYAWPSDSVLQALKPGQKVPEKLLASATTASGGGYAFAVPKATLDAAAVSQGWANLEVDTVGGASWDFAYHTDQAKTVTVNLRLSGIPQCPRGTLGDGWFYSHQLSKALDTVGQGYILKSPKTRGDSVGFTYRQAQSSTLGIGFSAKADNSGFQFGGTESESASSGVSFPALDTGAWFKTRFRVARYLMFCLGYKGHPQKGCPKKTPTGATDIVKCIFKVRSNGWSGGATISYPNTAPRTPRYDCDQYARGTGFHRDNGAAVNWSKGFELAADGIGFNTETQTGYDTDGHMTFSFGHKGYLCGTNADDATAAQLVARGTLP